MSSLKKENFAFTVLSKRTIVRWIIVISEDQGKKFQETCDELFCFPLLLDESTDF